MTPRIRLGVCYLQVRRSPNYLHELSAVKITKGKPEVVESGCIVIKLNLRIPDTAFEPLSAEIDIDVPEDAVHRSVDVEVVPYEPSSSSADDDA